MLFICYFKIKELRIKNSLTQEELAHRIGVSQGYLSLLEQNDKDKIAGLTVKIIYRIANTLNVTIPELIEFDKND